MPKSRNRRSNGRTKKQSTQETGAAHGTLVDVRQGMRRIAATDGQGDKALRYVIIASVVLVGLTLLGLIVAS
ncbi:MAG: hypothetical protein ACI81R_001741 [Bradymonadia bacterium]|jgi:hypothetical protein